MGKVKSWFGSAVSAASALSAGVLWKALLVLSTLLVAALAHIAVTVWMLNKCQESRTVCRENVAALQTSSTACSTLVSDLRAEAERQLQEERDRNTALRLQLASYRVNKSQMDQTISGLRDELTNRTEPHPCDGQLVGDDARSVYERALRSRTREGGGNG